MVHTKQTWKSKSSGTKAGTGFHGIPTGKVVNYDVLSMGVVLACWCALVLCAVLGWSSGGMISLLACVSGFELLKLAQ